MPQLRREDRKGHASCVSGEVCANSVISKRKKTKKTLDTAGVVRDSALPDARSRSGVNGGGEFCARPVKPFGGGRPWLRWTRALCKFNGGKERR